MWGPNWPFRCFDLDCYWCFCHLMIDFAIAECWTYRFHRWTLVAANSMWRAFVGWYGGFANLLIAFLQNFSNHKYFYNLNKYNFKFCQMHLICGMVQLLTYMQMEHIKDSRGQWLLYAMLAQCFDYDKWNISIHSGQWFVMVKPSKYRKMCK